MSEMTLEDVVERKQRDLARLKKIAIKHSITVLAAITLWAAADSWASTSSLGLAHIVSMLNAIFAGTIISYHFHEWGHFSGARLSGAVSPVPKEPRTFFMFGFKYSANSRGQFLAMSAGGPIANWGLVILVLLALPQETTSQILLLATTFAIAVSVSVFEFPVINRVMYGDDPEATIATRQEETGSMPRNVGIVAGAALFFIL